MSSLLAQLQERARRRALDDRMGAFLRGRYEFTKDPVHRVRRQDVYRAVAQETGETDNNDLRCRVADLVERLGAREIRPANVALFCRMRPRDPAYLPDPGPAGPAALARLQRSWYARLAAEGMGDKDGEPKQLKRFEEHRRDISTAFIARAVEHYWQLHKEVQILGLYALEGLSVVDVATRLDTTRAHVQEVIDRMKLATSEPNARERRIWDLHQQGKSVREIGVVVRLNRNSVAQIVARMKAVRSKPPGYETGDEG